jgi:hypothetical protein
LFTRLERGIIDAVEGGRCQSATFDVANTCLPVRMAADMEQEMDLSGEQPDLFRAEHMYYQSVRLLQETEDGAFLRFLPLTAVSFMHSEGKGGDLADRWIKAVSIARDIDDLLKRLETDRPVVTCRAKGMFSIWGKLKRYDLDPDEIFDRLGIKVVVCSIEEAYRVRDEIIMHYPLNQPHQFRRRNETYQQVRDSLVTPRDSGYAAVNMNPVSPQHGIFEVQITTLEAIANMHRQENAARTILHLGKMPPGVGMSG